jgi:hypothetical protein
MAVVAFWLRLIFLRGRLHVLNFSRRRSN